MPKLEGCLFSVAEDAKTDMKWPLCATDAGGSGKVYTYMQQNIGEPGIRKKLLKSSIHESELSS